MALAIEADGVRPAPGVGLWANLKLVAYWATLGAAAGGLGGLLIGGVGGRLAMFFLRLTSDDSVRGLESDDGFIIGRFGLEDTASLLIVTAVLGAIVGLIMVAGRPFLPRRGMPIAWALAGATAGSAIIIQQDGIDFTALGPHWFAVALFVLIPGLGAGVIAWLTEFYTRFWSRRRWLSAFAAIAALPSVVFPVGVAASLIVGVPWAVAMRSRRLRSLPDWRPARLAAVIVFAIVVAIGLVDVVRDANAIV